MYGFTLRKRTEFKVKCSEQLGRLFNVLNLKKKRDVSRKTTMVLKWLTDNGDLSIALKEFEKSYIRSDADPVLKKWLKGSIVAEGETAEQLLDQGGMDRLISFFERDIVNDDGEQCLFPYKTTISDSGKKYITILVSRDKYRWDGLLLRLGEYECQSYRTNINNSGAGICEGGAVVDVGKLSDTELSEYLLPFTGVVNEM